MTWSYSTQLIGFRISFNLRSVSVSPTMVQDVKNLLDASTNVIIPAGIILLDGEFNVIAFQPNCKCSYWNSMK